MTTDEKILNTERQNNLELLDTFKSMLINDCLICQDIQDVCEDCQSSYDAEESRLEHKAILKAMQKAREDERKLILRLSPVGLIRADERKKSKMSYRYYAFAIAFLVATIQQTNLVIGVMELAIAIVFLELAVRSKEVK